MLSKAERAYLKIGRGRLEENIISLERDIALMFESPFFENKDELVRVLETFIKRRKEEVRRYEDEPLVFD